MIHSEPDLLDVDPRYGSPRLAAPSERGYLHLAAHVDAPERSGPILSRSRAHRALLAELKQLAQDLAHRPGVERAVVFDAALIEPPGYYQGEWGSEARPPHFDVAVLVETRSPEAATAVRHSDPYRRLVDALGARAKRMHAITARNAKRIADVEDRPGGLYMFQYYVAADPRRMLRLWDHVAGWYQRETGLSNGTLLVPVEGEASDYVAIDHARWDIGLWRLLWRQVTKESFWKVVRRSLETNEVAAMRILYRLA